MKKYLFILLALTLVAASCKNRHKVAKAEKEMETLSSEGSDSTVVNDAFADLESEFDFGEETTEVSVFAYLERGACFGRCPIYNLTINSDGSAIYNGTNFVDRMGQHKATFTEEELMEISTKAKEFGLDTMALEYDNNHVTDLPVNYIGATIDGEFKQIKMRYGYPENLRDFRDYMEKMVKGKDWIAIRPSGNSNN